jgi:hypothetical protein
MGDAGSMLDSKTVRSGRVGVGVGCGGPMSLHEMHSSKANEAITNKPNDLFMRASLPDVISGNMTQFTKYHE